MFYIMRLIWCCCLLGLGVDLSSQTRLDSLYTLVRHDSRGDLIALDGEEIIVIGSARDTSSSAVGIVFSRFSLDGELLISNYEFDGLVYFINSNELIFYDSVVYVAPHMSWPPRFLLKYDRYSGEILEKIEIPSVKSSHPIVTPYGMGRVDINRFALVCIILEDHLINETQITLFDMRDGGMRHLHNAYPGYHQNMKYIEWKEDKIYLAGDLVKGDPNESNFDLRLTIVTLDTLGTELWRYISPGLRGFTSDCFIEENGDIVIAHSFYKNYYNGAWWIPTCRPGISRIRADGTIAWERPIGRNHYNDDAFDNRINVMLPASAGDGYIIAGAQSNFSIEDYWAEPFVDTIATGEYLQDDAIIAKVSNEGDILWTRTYSKVSGIYTDDIFFDMIYHPDGGYLLSGYVAEYIPGEPLVRTWLLYLDEYGCAVPGCQTVATENIIGVDMPILIYPNPASAELFIYQTENGRQEYIIGDMSGKVIDRFKGNTEGHTFIVDISAYPPGIYVITRTDDRGHSLSEKWVKN